MPRRHLKSKLRSNELTPLVLEGLVTGHFFFAEPTEDEQRVFWLQHREKLIEATIRARPGTRPAAWWKFDAPAARERIGGVGDVRGELWFGVPAEIHSLDPKDPPRFESQVTHLHRHGLLTRAEFVALAGKEIAASGDWSEAGVWISSMPPWESERQAMEWNFAVRLNDAGDPSSVGRVARRRPARITRLKRLHSAGL